MTLLAAACLPCLHSCASRGWSPQKRGRPPGEIQQTSVQSIDRLDLVLLFSGADYSLLYSSLLASG